MSTTYSHKEKLKSEKLISQLFLEGKSVSAYPLRMVYLKTTFTDAVKIKAGVSVSKRNFKKAVDRNRIKRLLREAYRLEKDSFFNNMTTQYAFMILYIGKEKPTYTEVEIKMKQLLQKFIEKSTKE
ncbi:ribonuclease P protein component [Xanthomarina spongicola]|uniref:Ribonuclease P protein component n=1 Tax=Xanthomarina spongicola TaxID=570520 RepID=A0A316DVD1_9FLAO|nr:ribonuclease P protein component [Xanthomarina spongicola]PWK20533.1 ribonuclease P protein component [Xanthomarina spongicola]